jgi:predicted RNase H-like HicB family nuclease
MAKLIFLEYPAHYEIIVNTMMWEV